MHVQHSTKRVMFLGTKPIIHTIPPSKPVSLLTPVFLSEGEIDAVKKEANIQMNRLILDQTFFPTDDAALGRMAELALDKAIAKCSNGIQFICILSITHEDKSSGLQCVEVATGRPKRNQEAQGRIN